MQRSMNGGQRQTMAMKGAAEGAKVRQNGLNSIGRKATIFPGQGGLSGGGTRGQWRQAVSCKHFALAALRLPPWHHISHSAQHDRGRELLVKKLASARAQASTWVSPMQCHYKLMIVTKTDRHCR